MSAQNMKPKHIIIASHAKDRSAVYLKKRLAEMGHRSHIINFGGFPETMSATVLVESASARSSIDVPRRLKLEPGSVKGIWWRRPQGPARSIQPTNLEKYVQNESDIALASTLALFEEATWVSEPEATRIANRKPIQLAMAQRIGFRVPETCISNDPKEVEAFIGRHHRMDFVMKPVGSSFVRLADDPHDAQGENRAIYTKIVDIERLLEHIHQASNCPFILQEAIVKDSDIRVTVVGDEAFAAEIVMRSNPIPGNLDWRHHDVERDYGMHALPPRISRMCVELVQALGLRFGCLDLSYSRTSGYAFFEINPQGQWMPSELIVGHPISTALGRLLTRKNGCTM